MTHDLSYALGELGAAACRYPNGVLGAVKALPVRDLAVAAVAFTIQLAIDKADRDPTDLRALERELLAVIAALGPA